MNDIDRFDWGTPFRVYRPPISTDGSHTIEKFDTKEQAELYAAATGGTDVCGVLTFGAKSVTLPNP